ncbi:MAG: asparagine synthase (glutamine-hydrolyzing) [Verrucomicrobia bacterium]|nr:MAG: asparagine synthase (glutamine-hydrolyzing) [Verrucomicrobiota bacterium]
MCGIAGIIGPHSESALEYSLATLRIRGPDGTSITRLDGIDFGSTRLAIVDLKQGEQPFEDSEGRFILHGSGEIYNADELRETLCREGCRFRSLCDIEVIVHAWAKWGPVCISKLNGMFAIALWDKQEHELHLFRDPCGQKPLYYHHTADRFAFASEIRALRALGIFRQLDPAAIAAYLTLRYVPGPRTTCHQITELGAGQYLKLDRSRKISQRLIRYQSDPKLSLSVESIDSLRNNAVRIASRADVPIALYLSGGVDSWLLADANQKHGKARHAITLDFPSALGEGEAAARIARENGLQHHRIPWSNEWLKRLPDLIDRLESPIGDPLVVAFDLLAETARGIGAKVVLSGEGPDEWFGGYSFHRAAGWADTICSFGGAVLLPALAQVISRSGPLADHISSLRQSIGDEGRRRIAAWIADWPDASPEERANGLRRLFRCEEIQQIAQRPGWVAADLAALEPFTPESQGLPLIHRALASQSSHWLPGWVIGRHEKIALARGLEIRMPFLDPRLAALQFPDAKKTWRLCAAKAGWADSKKPKQAFALPAADLVRSPEFLELASAYLSESAVRQRAWFAPAKVVSIQQRALKGSFLAAKQWAALVMLEIWERGQK